MPTLHLHAMETQVPVAPAIQVLVAQCILVQVVLNTRDLVEPSTPDLAGRRLQHQVERPIRVQVVHTTRVQEAPAIPDLVVQSTQDQAVAHMQDQMAQQTPGQVEATFKGLVSSSRPALIWMTRDEHLVAWKEGNTRQVEL